jgi:hypothetical protein
LTQSSTFHLVAADVFNITYGDGTSDAGDYFTDVVRLGKVTIDAGELTMGLATNTANGPHIANDGHGLLGVGYEIGESIVQVEGARAETPAIYNVLVKQGVINRAAYSLYLNDDGSGKGEVLFGAIDTTKYSGDLVSLPVQPMWDGVTNYTEFLVALTAISVTDDSGTRLLTDSTFAHPALLDSGAVSQYLPAGVADEIFKGFGVIQGTLPCEYRNSNASLTYTFGGDGGPRINVPLSAMIVDDGYAILPDGRPECQILVTSENGNGVILGDSFLRSAYVVYDLKNNEIAIAQAVLNATSTSNILTIPSGTGLPGVSSTATLILSHNGAATTAPPAGATTAVATGTTLPSPTFNLGSVATAFASSTSGSSSSSATSSSSSGRSSSSGASATFVPGPWVMVLLLGSTPLLAACIFR